MGITERMGWMRCPSDHRMLGPTAADGSGSLYTGQKGPGQQSYH